MSVDWQDESARLRAEIELLKMMFGEMVDDSDTTIGYDWIDIFGDIFRRALADTQEAANGRENHGE